VAYDAQKGDRWIFVIDGTESRPYDGTARGLLSFSPDGERVACVAVDKGKYVLVVDGVEHVWDGIAEIRFSPDGRLAAVVRRGPKWMVVVDGEEGPGYDGVAREDPVFSSDGARMAYAAKKGNRWVVVTDGVEGPAYDEIGQGAPLFSPDGSHVAYIGTSGEDQFIVIDGVQSPAYDGVAGNGPTFHEDGTLEYLALAGDVLYRVKAAPTVRRAPVP
jgi:hypothetical protein